MMPRFLENLIKGEIIFQQYIQLRKIKSQYRKPQPDVVRV